MLSNKLIVVTNDDGYNAEGIKYLVKELYKYTHNIFVIAPEVEMSAVSHMMTLRRGLKLTKQNPIYEDITTYSLDGTPSDCIKFALLHFDLKPDYIISGINNGLNMGDDILYSGTVAACFEASLNGYPSMAFSCERGEFEAIKNLPMILEYISQYSNLSNQAILNINMPLKPIGCKKTVQGLNPFDTSYEYRDGLYYALGNPLGPEIEKNPNADIYAYYKGYVSITPLTTDRTNYD